MEILHQSNCELEMPLLTKILYLRVYFLRSSLKFPLFPPVILTPVSFLPHIQHVQPPDGAILIAF